MRRRIRLFPYGPSGSARALSQRLGIPRIRIDGTSRFRPRDGDVLVNWGRASGIALPMRGVVHVINKEHSVACARDKVRAFGAMTAAGVPTVDWTTDPDVAQAWLNGGDTVFIRRSTTGQGGSGIVVVTSPGFVAPAPLYTKQFKARHEYRVHVFGPYTFVQKKRRRNGTEPNAVRNHANGYVYCTNGVEAPACVTSAAAAAIAACGLDFGAVDILCTEGGEARVLEVNTAPGLEGRTLDFYVERFNEKLHGVAA